jgi:microsomal dipeptidase-like Zn-dependent dipeptidase
VLVQERRLRRESHWLRRAGWFGLGLLVAAALFFGAFPLVLAWRMSQQVGSPTPLNARALTLHSRLLVVDLQAASLMWSRDLLGNNVSGHLDLPRLTDGNVALQVLSAASRLSWRGDAHGLDRDADERENDGVRRADLLTPLAVAQGWPVETWVSRLRRVLYQAEKLKWLVRRAGSGLITIRSQSDIDRLMLARAQAQSNGLTPPVGIMLSIHDSQALEDRLENLEALFEAGFRMAAPPSVHHPLMGRQWLTRMEEKGMVVDVAHAGATTLRDLVGEARLPVVASHAGLRGNCDDPRNLTDEQARGIAATGGVIGIGFWRDAVCEASVDAIVAAIRYAVGLVGVDHVAFGSNFDGASPMPIDAAGLAQLTQGLTAAGFSDDDIGKLAGGNALRVLRAVLPR